MIYTINTGSLTRYSCFQWTVYLDSYLVQYMFNDSLDYSKVLILCCIVISDNILQCAVMPNNLIYVAIEFLVTKCKTKGFDEDRADQCYPGRFKYMSTRSLHS